MYIVRVCFSVASQLAPAKMSRKVICYHNLPTFWLNAPVIIRVKAFSEYIGKLFSELKLVTDNLPLHLHVSRLLQKSKNENFLTPCLVWNLVPRLSYVLIFQLLCLHMIEPGDEANVPVATHVKLNANNVAWLSKTANKILKYFLLHCTLWFSLLTARLIVCIYSSK